jgi:hypothetical protein
MAIMAELGDMGVADLLYLLAIRRKTGHITVNADGHEVRLMVDDGRLVRVTSSDLTLRLGRMLLRLGALRPDQLSEALQEQEQAGRGRPLGRILVERGWVKPADLARCVETQCVEILARIIVAEQGSINFTRGPVPLLGPDQPPINADRVLLEATRRSDELAALRPLLPPAAAPLMVASGVEAVLAGLSDDEILVAATLQSSAGSLAELTERLALDELVIWRAVLAMRERGLLVAGEPAVGGGGTAPRPDPAPTEEPARLAENDLHLLPFDAPPDRARELSRR